MSIRKMSAQPAVKKLRQLTIGALAGAFLLAVPVLAIANLKVGTSFSEREASTTSFRPFEAPTVTEAARQVPENKDNKGFTIAITGQGISDNEGSIASLETWEEAKCHHHHGHFSSELDDHRQHKHCSTSD